VQTVGQDVALCHRPRPPERSGRDYEAYPLAVAVPMLRSDVEFGDRLEVAWAGAQAALPPGWRLDGLRCASTGLTPELHSELWRAVAVAPNGEETSGEGQDPLDALANLVKRFGERR
jgi:hypothetical protein